MRRVTYGNYMTNRRGSVDSKVFGNLTDADAVLDRLSTYIKNNGYVTVEQYYQLTNGEALAGDSEYGWTTLVNCQIIRTRYGYELQMALPEQVVDNTDYLNEAYKALRDDGDTDAAMDYLDQYMEQKKG